MELRWFQKGFNYSQDGPGNRLVYHLQGCNLHCPWCSNPEGMDPAGNCVSEAVEKVVNDIISAKPMFFDQGGVTFTGGECTLQLDALLWVLKAIKAQGVHTAIETNGLSPRISDLFPYLDLLMLDVKHHDPEKHKKITGRGNIEIKQTLKAALDAGVRSIVRIPLIHGFNDLPGDMEGFCHFFGQLRGFGIELLPYHEYGKIKWKQAGKTYQIRDGFVEKNHVQAFTDCLTEAGFDIIQS